MKHKNSNFCTTSAILLEFDNAFSRISLKPVAISLILAIQKSQKWNCIVTDDVLFNKGFTLYQKMQDKEWGLVDCTSIIVAREMELREIFSTDHHFEQAGFTILLK